jgi:hypothetical protein
MRQIQHPALVHAILNHMSLLPRLVAIPKHVNVAVLEDSFPRSPRDVRLATRHRDITFR